MARTTFRPSHRSDTDNITSLLEKVASGAVSVKDARRPWMASNSRRRRWIAP